MIQIKTIVFSRTASVKIDALVKAIDKEVGWHGIVSHDKPDTYIISDILIHPQLSYNALVDSDEKEYTKWLYSYPPDVFGHIRYQGHSHVNMPVFSSGIDDKHQKSIVAQFSVPEDFYIFSVHNKKKDRLLLLYEADAPHPFSDKDISIIQADDACGPVIEPLTSIPEFIKQAKKQITSKREAGLCVQKFMQRIRGRLDWI